MINEKMELRPLHPSSLTREYPAFHRFFSAEPECMDIEDYLEKNQKFQLQPIHVRTIVKRKAEDYLQHFAVCCLKIVWRMKDDTILVNELLEEPKIETWSTRLIQLQIPGGLKCSSKGPRIPASLLLDEEPKMSPLLAISSSGPIRQQPNGTAYKWEEGTSSGGTKAGGLVRCPAQRPPPGLSRPPPKPYTGGPPPPYHPPKPNPKPTSRPSSSSGSRRGGGRGRASSSGVQQGKQEAEGEGQHDEDGDGDGERKSDKEKSTATSTTEGAGAATTNEPADGESVNPKNERDWTLKPYPASMLVVEGPPPGCCSTPPSSCSIL